MDKYEYAIATASFDIDVALERLDEFRLLQGPGFDVDPELAAVCKELRSGAQRLRGIATSYHYVDEDEANAPFEPVEGQPERFVCGIGGMTGESYSVELTGRVLVYRSWGGPNRRPDRYRIPTPESWAAFWVELDAIDAWSWAADYESELPIVDGTSWSVDIVHDGRALRSSGSNVAPSDPDQTGGFSRYLAAVATLVGFPFR